MNNIAPIFIIAFVALFIAIAVFGVLGARQRKKELEDFCKANGLEFNPARRSDPGEDFPRMALMHEGHSRYGNNWCEGPWRGRELCCFDYHYTTGSGKNQTSYILSILVLENARPLKSLSIRPEGFFDKVGEFFGAQEIHFESDQFNRRFHVKCEDRKWAYDALPPRTLELLLSAKWSVHLQLEGRMVYAWDGKTWRSQEIGDRAQLVSNLLDLIPDFAAR